MHYDKVSEICELLKPYSDIHKNSGLDILKNYQLINNYFCQQLSAYLEQINPLHSLSDSVGKNVNDLLSEAIEGLIAKYQEKLKDSQSVFIVEDAVFMRSMLQDTMIKHGFKVIGYAEDGIDALEKLQTVTPNFVFLGVVMPRMDGLTCLPLIKAMHPNTKVVMITAMCNPSYVIDSYRAGADAFVVKPFDNDKLLHVVRNIEDYQVNKESLDSLDELLKSFTDRMTQDEIDEVVSKCKGIA